jgi:hypothetical protein
MSNPMVTVVGPHNRHIEVHESTQKALPDAFPLPPAPKPNASKKSATRPTAKRTRTKRDSEQPTTPVVEPPAASDSPAPAVETATVEPTKEAR